MWPIKLPGGNATGWIVAGILLTVGNMVTSPLMGIVSRMVGTAMAGAR